jgi:hypothetical protein
MSITMKKGIARLGIIGFVSLFAFPCFSASISDLLISEIMANPAGLSDTHGEWFELYNPTIEPINLHGLDLGDDGRDRHRFDSDLLILPSEFLTLARSTDPGFEPDYVYDKFSLANSADEIVFRDGLLELLRLDYDSGFALAGISRELQQLPMLASSYGLTLASLSYGSGDIGTPGVAGDMLLTPSAVPIPATAWLFIIGLLAVFSPTALRKALATRVIPTTSIIPKTSVILIRRTASKAARSDVSVRRIGIWKWPKIPTSRIKLSLHRYKGLQS